MFNHPYWPSLDNPGEWNLYQVNQITKAAVHPNGMIDVLDRIDGGSQYITLLQEPTFNFIAQVYSSDPNHNVPPTSIDPKNVLYEAACNEGIGEIASDVPLQTQVPPLVILPWNPTVNQAITEPSKITGPSISPYNFSYATTVAAIGKPFGPWPDCCITTYFEPANKIYRNYYFAKGAFGKPRGLVYFVAATVDSNNVATGQLEYFAYQSGKI